MGDLPKPLQIKTGDLPGRDVTTMTTKGTGRAAQVILEMLLDDKSSAVDLANKYLNNYVDLDAALDKMLNAGTGSSPDSQDARASRREAMASLATILQTVGERTKELATAGDPAAGPAAELCGALLEATRGALKMPARGGMGASTLNDKAIAYRRQWGKDAAGEIKKSEEDRDREQL